MNTFLQFTGHLVSVLSALVTGLCFWGAAGWAWGLAGGIGAWLLSAFIAQKIEQAKAASEAGERA